MYFLKQQISAKVSEISQQKHLHDNKLSQLQLLITSNKKYGVVELRNKFSQTIQHLNSVARDNSSVLDLLRYRSQKLAKQGTQVQTQLMRIQSLKQYFAQFRQKIKRQQIRGQQIISGRQRWQLTSRVPQSGSSNSKDQQQQSLIHSNQAARQSVQIARSVFQNLSNQSSKLQSVREKMGSVLHNINLVGNIAQLLRTRSREDNKLIMRLSVGLVIWVLVCVYVIRPIVRSH